MDLSAFAAAVLASFVQQATPCAVPGTDSYDRQFRAAAQSYLPARSVDEWCLVKALAFAESSLRPDARSAVGAEGLLQVMPETFRETSKRVGLSCLPYDATCSIHVGTAYFGRMLRFWSSPRPEQDREDLAIASYNAGPGSLQRSQSRCYAHTGGDCLSYPDIAEHLPAITGKHATETLNHVKRVRAYQRGTG